jgi:hypothetical protein
MQTIIQAVGEYFDRPIADSNLFYADARLVEQHNGSLFYGLVDGAQPLGKPWDLYLVDRLSQDVGCAHVGYATDGGYCHEILTFLRLKAGQRLVSVLRAVTPARYCSVFDSPADETAALNDLSRILLTYCDSVYNLDAAGALAMFFPGARMIHPVDGEIFADVSCDVFRERWAGLPHPASLGLPRYAHICHIELLSATTAIAKVGVAKLNEYFNDYLFCIDADAGWRIAHKLTQSLCKDPPFIESAASPSFK